MYFLTSTGLLMAGIDGNISKDELENMVKYLSSYTVFPRKLIEDVLQSQKIIELFEQSVQNIVKEEPNERYAMFNYLISLSYADNELAEEELQLLYKLGTEMFHFSKKEIFRMIAEKVQTDFVPKLRL
jgi:uncharacterized tellurite resistance protein B-like protein